MWIGALGGTVAVLGALQGSHTRDTARSQVDSARVIVETLVRSQHIPGLAVTVTRGDSVLWHEGFGLADRDAARAAEPTTAFRIGSLSKLFTAVLLMRLAEQHMVALDTPIGTYLPLPARIAPITLRQLSGHLGGIRHYRGREFFTRTHYANLRAGLQVFLGDSLVAPPGTRYVYSSYGYNLIGAVLEAATRRPYTELFRQQIVGPLRLVATVPDSSNLPERARLYDVDTAGTVRDAQVDDLSGRWPSGGLLSSTDDLARFAQALFTPGFLTQGSLDQMFTPQHLSSGASTGVGIGWRIATDSAGRTYWHHGGTSNGGSAFLLIYPAEHVVVAMASNAFTGWGQPQAMAVAQVFLPLRQLPN